MFVAEIKYNLASLIRLHDSNDWPEALVFISFKEVCRAVFSDQLVPRERCLDTSFEPGRLRPEDLEIAPLVNHYLFQLAVST
jgi:hypothetical protein